MERMKKRRGELRSQMPTWNQRTITSKAWHVFERTNHQQDIQGYGVKGGMKTYDVVNIITKAWIPGRKEPILLAVNYATLNDDGDENESLIVPFEMMRHGISIDLIPKQFGGEGGMMVEDEDIPFKWDGGELFLKIAKPNEGELE
eukprot:10664765-Ditylum_brightwellii.AAC.2